MDNIWNVKPGRICTYYWALSGKNAVGKFLSRSSTTPNKSSSKEIVLVGDKISVFLLQGFILPRCQYVDHVEWTVMMTDESERVWKDVIIVLNTVLPGTSMHGQMKTTKNLSSV